MDGPPGNVDAEELNRRLSELLRRIADSRDESAFEELYDLYSGPIYGLILSLVRERSEAEDILQELFVSVWEKADRFDPRLGKAKSWLMTLARNRSYDHLDRIRRRGNAQSAAQEQSEAGVSEPAHEASTHFETEEETLSAVQALKKLNRDQQEAIRLTFLVGLTQREVADELGEPLGTVKARIRRGLLTLKRFVRIEERGGSA